MGIFLERLKSLEDKGKELERITQDLLIDMGFVNVTRQKGGSQYGYDIFAQKGEEKWKIECKNLSKALTIGDIAPKLIWHFESKIDRFVIISVSDISNDLVRLLENHKFPFPIEIWTGEFLEQLILLSPTVLERLGIGNIQVITEKSGPLVFEPAQVNFNIHYSWNPPYSYDYFLLNGEIKKAYTEHKFNLTGTIANNSSQLLVLNEINVITVAYTETQGRILRQHKAKGKIEPTKFKFLPSKQLMGHKNLLNENERFEVKPGASEVIIIELDRNCPTGYYQIIFESRGFLGGSPIILSSAIFPLNIAKKNSHFLELNVIDKHYDGPVMRILSSSSQEWWRMKNVKKGRQHFLGPTDVDLIKGGYEPDKTWKVRSMKYKTVEKKGIERTVKLKTSEIIVELNVPVEEKIWTPKDGLDNEKA